MISHDSTQNHLDRSVEGAIDTLQMTELSKCRSSGLSMKALAILLLFFISQLDNQSNVPAYDRIPNFLSHLEKMMKRL